VREHHLKEMDLFKAEESHMKELENYNKWARKEKEVHLRQQRQQAWEPPTPYTHQSNQDNGR
jgi:hypothetical protein